MLVNIHSSPSMHGKWVMKSRCVPFITRCHSGQSIAKLGSILKDVSTLFQSMKHKLQLSIIKLPECFLQVPYTCNLIYPKTATEWENWKIHGTQILHSKFNSTLFLWHISIYSLIQAFLSLLASWILHGACFWGCKIRKKEWIQGHAKDMPHALAWLILKKSLQNNHHGLLSPLADRVWQHLKPHRNQLHRPLHRKKNTRI
jgi:hypothetical protein